MENKEASTPAKERIVKANIEVRVSPIHGYGVFAVQDIAAKELIEECPVIVVSKSGTYGKNLYDRVFSWGDDCAVALGYGSMYNHDSDANAKYDVDMKNQIMRFVAAKDIAAGAEILIYYGDNWFALRKPPTASEILTIVPPEPQCKVSPAVLVLGVLLFLSVLSLVFPIDSDVLFNETSSKQLASISAKAL